MANAIPTILSNLTFSGTDLQRANLSIHLAVTRGYREVYATRGPDTIIPSLAGRVFREREPDVLAIELEGWVQGVGATEADRLASFASLVAKIKVLFDPMLDPDTLLGTNYAGNSMAIACRPVSDGLRWGPEDITGVCQLIVLMEAVDGAFWEGGGS